jgi:hypothetical protein
VHVADLGQRDTEVHWVVLGATAEQNIEIGRIVAPRLVALGDIE